MDNWLSIDEKDHAIFNLDILKDLLEKEVKTNEYQYWSIIIMVLHSTVQGFMVWALTGADYSRVLSKNDRKKYLAWLDSHGSGESGINIEKLHLADFDILYRRIKSSSDMAIYNNSQELNATEEEDKSIVMLNNYRNNFVHFIPKSWSIEISGLPNLVRQCLGIINFLVFGSNNIFCEEKRAENIRLNIERCKQLVGVLEKRYLKNDEVGS